MSASTAAEVADQVREARAAGATLRIVGAGRWLEAGAPCSAIRHLELSALSGITEYEPGDLTLTARAATPLAEIERATAAHGQWLPLDPFGDARGTLGAMVATASYGPLAAAFGTPRNQVLGCEIVTGAGEIVRAGGKVVKNVAGFDITRLMIGAWGTLGALTSIAVRLRARPEIDATVAIALGTSENVEHARRWLRASEFTPLAAELLSPALAARLGMVPATAPVLLLRLGGNAALVRAALHSATALGDAVAQDSAVWRALATAEGAGSATLRLSAAPARIAALWNDTWRVAERAGGWAHANLTRGVVRCVLPADGPDAMLSGALASLPDATRIAERLPAALWEQREADAVTTVLTHGVRRAFDPDGLLNPGILGAAG